MEKASIENMELGNILFGSSRGEYAVTPRDIYEVVMFDFLKHNGFDLYGYYLNTIERVFENDIFVMRPYYWGDNEKEALKPNFIYKPTGLEIRWYKYPFRDSYSNQNISVEEFKKIMHECELSLSGE